MIIGLACGLAYKLLLGIKDMMIEGILSIRGHHFKVLLASLITDNQILGRLL